MMRSCGALPPRKRRISEAFLSERLENFIRELKSQNGVLTEFDERLWSCMVDFVTVGRKKELTVTFRDGTEIRA